MRSASLTISKTPTALLLRMARQRGLQSNKPVRVTSVTLRGGARARRHSPASIGGRVRVEVLARREPALLLPARVHRIGVADAVVRPRERAIFLDDEAERASVAAVAQRMHDDADVFAFRVALAVHALARGVHDRGAFEAPRRHLAVGARRLDDEP